MCQRSAPIPPQVDLEERSKVLASVLFLFLECACDFFLCWCLLVGGTFVSVHSHSCTNRATRSLLCSTALFFVWLLLLFIVDCIVVMVYHQNPFKRSERL